MNPTPTVCPFIDRGDPRCAECLTLLNLRETFRLCFGQPVLCPVYHLIQLQEPAFHAPGVVTACAC